VDKHGRLRRRMYYGFNNGVTGGASSNATAGRRQLSSREEKDNGRH